MPATPDAALVGIDTGGTFTDVVVLERGRLRHCKVLSTPQDPSRAIHEGMDRLGLAGQAAQVVHGTTVGTNAVLEGKGARVAYVTCRGFGDVLALGRQNREAVYRLAQPEQAPPVPPELCLEIDSRADATGAAVERVPAGELEALGRRIAALGVEAVAVNLLFSFLDDSEERRVARALDPELFVSLSSAVLPEIREYERGIATWLNAAVGPVIQRYLAQVARRLPHARFSVMQSSGTTVAAEQAAGSAVRLLLSGPAGGIAAARLIGEVTGWRRLLTLDMGGTSTDVSLLDGGIPLTNSSRIGRWPLTVPTVDIHTIGAGGGSIARVDEGGLLLVGPESAGAEPGPAAYGRGGTAVTVTDANVVLGRIPADTLLGGYLPLDPEAARAAMDGLARQLGVSRLDAARGVIRTANEHMARALRVMSVERGHDPRAYALLCFGGAGGLHACELAELLGNRRVILPGLAGVLSAHGMLASEPGRDLSAAVLKPVSGFTDEQLDSGFAELQERALGELRGEGVDPGEVRFVRRLELRYAGQSAGIPLDFQPGSDHAETFHQAHLDTVGHRLEHPVELVNLRLGARARAPLTRLQEAPPPRAAEPPRKVYLAGLRRAVPLLERRCLGTGTRHRGPAIVTDSAATAWLAPGWEMAMDRWGNLVLERVTGDA